MPHWWGDARLDKTPWLQMKGMMTPNEHHWYSPRIGSVLDKLCIPVPEELISAGALCARYLPALAVSMHTEPPRRRGPNSSSSVPASRRGEICAVQSSALLADGNCSRVVRPVFCSMLLTWDSTVLVDMNRRWEISALLRPALTSRRISVSRAVIPSLARCGGTADLEALGTLTPIDPRM